MNNSRLQFHLPNANKKTPGLGLAELRCLMQRMQRGLLGVCRLGIPCVSVRAGPDNPGDHMQVWFSSSITYLWIRELQGRSMPWKAFPYPLYRDRTFSLSIPQLLRSSTDYPRA